MKTIHLLLFCGCVSAQAAVTQLNALSWCRADGSDQTANMQTAVNAAVTAGQPLYVPGGINYDYSALTNTTNLLLEDDTTSGQKSYKGTLAVNAPGISATTPGIETTGWVKSTNKYNGVLSAASFGILGDGSTVNNSAFSTALLTVEDNAELYFPSGIYMFTPNQTFVRSNIKLTGSGAIFKPTGTNISLMTWTGTNVWMEGITFDGDNLVNRALELTQECHWWTFKKCKFLNVTEPGSLNQQSVLLRLRESSSHILLDDCDFFNVDAPNSNIARGVLASVVDTVTYFDDLRIINCRFGNIGGVTDGDAIVIQNFTNQVNVLIANTWCDQQKRFLKAMSPGGSVINCVTTNSYKSGDLPYAGISIYADNWQISNYKLLGGRTYAGLETGSSALTATNVIWNNCIVQYSGDADLSAADGAQIVGLDTRNVKYTDCIFENVRVGVRLEAGGTNYMLSGISVQNASQRGINIDVDATTSRGPTGVYIDNLNAYKTTGNVIAMMAGTNIFVNGLRSFNTGGVFVNTNIAQYVVWNAYDPTVTINWGYGGKWGYNPNFNTWHIGSDFVGHYAMNVLSRFVVSGANTNYFLRFEANSDGANSINVIGPWETSLWEYDDNGNRLRVGSSIGDFILSTTNAYSAGPIQKPVYVERTGNGGYSVTAAKSGYQFSNQDVSGSFTTYNLPTPTAVKGERYKFYVADANGLVIQASGGATIRVGSNLSAVNGYLNNTTVGDIIELTAMNATNWVATSVTGYGWKVDNVQVGLDGYFDEIFLVNNNKQIWGRNSANSYDLAMVKIGSDNLVHLGSGTNNVTVPGLLGVGKTPRTSLDVQGALSFTTSQVPLTADNITTGSDVSVVELLSNDATPGNRTFNFNNNAVRGQVIHVYVIGGAAQLVDDAAISGGTGTYKLAGNWDATEWSALTLVSDGTNLVELSRSIK